MNREMKTFKAMAREHALAFHKEFAQAYLYKLPREVPTGKVMVHNSVIPTRRLGFRGFRAWLAAPDAPRLVLCDCNFAPELGPHYRVEPTV